MTHPERPEMIDAWTALMKESAPAIEAADEIVVAAITEVVPDWAPHKAIWLDNYDEGAAAIEGVLGHLETEIAALCSPHDFRTLLSLSRLCVGLPAFRASENSISHVRSRSQSADVWAINFGRHDVEGSFVESQDAGFYIGANSNELITSVVKLHRLAASYFWAVRNKVALNFLRLYSSEARERGPGVLLDRYVGVEPRSGSDVAEALRTSFALRFVHNNPLAEWGMVASGDAPQLAFAMSSRYNESITHERNAGGSIFMPTAIPMGGLLRYALRFRELFVRCVGMPPEHFAGILEGLGRLFDDANESSDGRTAYWNYLTGTALLHQSDILGGPLETAAAKVLQQAFSGCDRSDLDSSVERFVALASSSASFGDVNDTRSYHPARTNWPPYLMHGEPDHDVWVVDFVNTIPFVQRVYDMLLISSAGRTTGAVDHDAHVRTSILDQKLADFLGNAPHAELAFLHLRPDRGLPNVKVPLSVRGEEQEIDVPVRIGRVLVAVQTWATAVDHRIAAGEYEPLKKRWTAARRKLKHTDKRYAAALLADRVARNQLARAGISFVLPVLCGPFVEPVASANANYWLQPAPPALCACPDGSLLAFTWLRNKRLNRTPLISNTSQSMLMTAISKRSSLSSP